MSAVEPAFEWSGPDEATVHKPLSKKPPSAGIGFVLRVVGGPDAGRAFEIAPTHPSRVLIGQSSSSDLVLRDREVSRRHLALDLAEGRLRLSDLGSRNGTRVNGVAVVEVLLEGGERVDLGGTAIMIERAERTPEVPLSTAAGFGRVVGASLAMRRLYPLCQRIATSTVPVVIEGETGTGKEVLAESLHEVGPRSNGPFAVFDCTAVPPNLVESALFGHERGSFTGATETRRGVFEEANGGTLLIDEIGDLDIELQAKLLRALDRSEVRRIGGKSWLRTDVRVLAATRRDLDQEVAAGRFREDLFYRLAVARVELPPLRHRAGDVALLARTFWRRLATPTEPEPAGFVARLEAYSWPGNVRELHNAVARRVALGDLADVHAAGLAGLTTLGAPPSVPSTSVPAPATPPLEEADAPSIPSGAVASGVSEMGSIIAEGLPFPRAREKMMKLFERSYFEDVLRRHGGSVARAAAASGIARRYFQLLQARVRQRSAED